VKPKNLAAYFFSLVVLVFVTTVLFLWPDRMGLFFGLITAISILFVSFLKPFIGLLLLLGFIPFQSFFNFFLPPIGTVWMGAAIRDGLAAAVVLGWLFRKLRRKEAFSALSWAEKWAIIYMCVVAFYIPAAPVLEGGLVGFRNMVGYVVLFVISADVVDTQRRLLSVATIVVLSGFVLGLIGIAEVLTERDIFAIVGYDMVSLMGPDLPFIYLGTVRATGGTGNPLEFGLYMAIAGMICAAFLAARVPLIRRKFLIMPLIVMLAALLFTYARSAYVALFAGILGLVALSRKRRLLAPLLVSLVLLILISYTPYWELLGPRFKLEDTPGIATMNARVEVWKTVLKTGFSEWMGSGLGTHGGAVGRAGLDPYFNITDNYYGSILMQVGFIPLFLFLFFLGILTKTFFRLTRSQKDPSLKAYAASALTIVLMIAVNAFFSSAFESRTLSILVWILLGSSLRLEDNCHYFQSDKPHDY
jgi:hypothetical protein